MRPEPRGRVNGTLFVFLLALCLVGLFALAEEAWVFALVVLISAGAVLAVALREGSE